MVRNRENADVRLYSGYLVQKQQTEIVDNLLRILVKLPAPSLKG
jgi:hypothetical protein